MESEYSVGSKVFAKVRGYSPWPAEVTSVINETKNTKYEVYFYGTGHTAVVSGRDMCPYVQNKIRLGNKKAHGFARAIQEIESDLEPEELAEIQKLEREYQEVTGFLPPSYGTQVVKSSEYNCQNSNDEYSVDKHNGTCRGTMLYDENCEVCRTYIENESVILKADVDIRKALNYDTPDLNKCIKLLDGLMKLKLSALMLRKYKEIVYTMLFAKVYNGKVSDDLNEDEKELMLRKTSIIRKKAGDVLMKFASVLRVPPGLNLERFIEKEFLIHLNTVKDMDSSEQFFFVVDCK